MKNQTKNFYANLPEIILICIIFLTIFVFGYTQGWNQAHTQLYRNNWESQYEFLCNPFYNGKNYNDTPCETFFINATGNYCDGKKVCENKLKR